MIFCEFCGNFKNSFFDNATLLTASGLSKNVKCDHEFSERDNYCVRFREYLHFSVTGKIVRDGIWNLQAISLLMFFGV